MTEQDFERSLKQIYILTGIFTAAGFVWFFRHSGGREALGFLIGALGSFGNLWLFNWLSRAIAPAASGEPRQKPWSAGLFIGRYAGLWVVGYGTVRFLSVAPLPVLMGLLASTGAVLFASIFDLFRNFGGSRSSN